MSSSELLYFSRHATALYSPSLLYQELLSDCSEAPHVNQIEVQPQFQNKEIVAFCRDNDIHVTAYREGDIGLSVSNKIMFFFKCSSLGKGAEQLLEHPTVLEVSKGLDKTPAQVVN